MNTMKNTVVVVGSRVRSMLGIEGSVASVEGDQFVINWDNGFIASGEKKNFDSVRVLTREELLEQVVQLRKQRMHHVVQIALLEQKLQGAKDGHVEEEYD
jgi:hypothetical protein